MNSIEKAFEQGKEYDKVWLSPKNLDLSKNACNENDVNSDEIEIVKKEGKFFVFSGHAKVRTAIEEGKNLVAIKAIFE